MEEDIAIVEDILHDRDSLSERDFEAIERILKGYKDQKEKADYQDITIQNMKDFMEQEKKSSNILINMLKADSQKTLEEVIKYGKKLKLIQENLCTECKRNIEYIMEKSNE